MNADVDLEKAEAIIEMATPIASKKFQKALEGNSYEILSHGDQSQK